MPFAVTPTEPPSAANQSVLLNVLISGVPDSMRGALNAAVSETLGGLAGGDYLSVVLTRLTNGEWTVFVADGASLEIVDPQLTARIVRAVKERSFA